MPSMADGRTREPLLVMGPCHGDRLARVWLRSGAAVAAHRPGPSARRLRFAGRQPAPVVRASDPEPSLDGLPLPSAARRSPEPPRSPAPAARPTIARQMAAARLDPRVAVGPWPRPHLTPAARSGRQSAAEPGVQSRQAPGAK